MTESDYDASARQEVTNSHRPRLKRQLAVAVLCLCVAMLCLRSVLPSILDTIPTTRYGSATVPLFNAWTLVWNTQTVERGFATYFNAPIFFPASGSFAFSEPQPLSMVLTPMKSFGTSPALIYNTWLLLSLTLNGWVTFQVLTRLQCRMDVALAGATGVVLLPLVHDQLDVLQLVSLWPALWVIKSLVKLHQLAQQQQSRWIGWLGISFELSLAVFCSAATCLHHCLFSGIAFALTAWLLLSRQQILRQLIAIASALILAAILIWPWVGPMRSILKTHEFERGEDLVSQLSASPKDFLNVSRGNLFPKLSLGGRRPWYGSPGNIRSTLALLTVPILIGAYFRKKSVDRRLIVFLLAFAFASATLSLGSNLQIGEWKIWPLMTKWVPGLAQARSAFRFIYFYQLGILLLASVTVNTASKFFRQSGWQLVISRVLSIAGIFVLATEVLPSDLRLVGVPGDNEHTPWIAATQASAKTSKGVLIIPFAPGSDARDFELTTRWMLSFESTDLRLVNGYSGFFPKLHYDWQKFLNSKPSPWQLAEKMRANQVEIVVVMDEQFRTVMSEPVVAGLMFEEIRMDTTRNISVYRLK